MKNEAFTDAQSTLALTSGILERWCQRLKKKSGELADAQYDPKSNEPLNEAAHLQSAIALILEEHLYPALKLMRKHSGESSSGE